MYYDDKITTSVDLRGSYVRASGPPQFAEGLTPEAPVPEDCIALSPPADGVSEWNADLDRIREGHKADAGLGPLEKAQPRRDGSIVVESPGSCYHLKPGGLG